MDGTQTSGVHNLTIWKLHNLCQAYLTGMMQFYHTWINVFALKVQANLAKLGYNTYNTAFSTLASSYTPPFCVVRVFGRGRYISISRY